MRAPNSQHTGKRKKSLSSNVHEAGCELAMPTPVAASALQQITAAKGAGFEREDDSTVIKVYQRPSGIALRVAANDARGGEA